MALRGFRQFIKDRARLESSCFQEHSASKTVEILHDGIEIIINISLSKYEHNGEAIQFLRRVADELSALEKTTKSPPLSN